MDNTAVETMATIQEQENVTTENVDHVITENSTENENESHQSGLTIAENISVVDLSPENVATSPVQDENETTEEENFVEAQQVLDDIQISSQEIPKEQEQHQTESSSGNKSEENFAENVAQVVEKDIEENVDKIEEKENITQVVQEEKDEKEMRPEPEGAAVAPQAETPQKTEPEPELVPVPVTELVGATGGKIEEKNNENNPAILQCEENVESGDKEKLVQDSQIHEMVDKILKVQEEIVSMGDIATKAKTAILEGDTIKQLNECAQNIHEKTSMLFPLPEKSFTSSHLKQWCSCCDIL